MARLGDLVRALASARSAGTASVSCYLGLDPGTVPHADALASHVTALVDETRRAAAAWSEHAEHEEARRLREDVDRLTSFLENDLDRSGAHGLALFVSGPQEVWRGVRLPAPVDDAVHVGRSFVVAPLLPFLDGDRDVVLAAVGRDRGTIWRIDGARAVEVDDLSRDGQGQHDQGGWSQARYARARDVEAREHMRGVADAISELVREGSDTLLVVACLEEQRTAFAERFDPHVRDALVGWMEYEAHAEAEALLPGVERLLDEHLGRAREAQLERWREEHGQESGRASAGWAETLAAASDGRVDLLLVDGSTRDAHECTVCGRGYLEPGACELDSAPLEAATGGALELAIRATLAHGGRVRLVPAELESGAVALLRYPQPSPVSGQRR